MFDNGTPVICDGREGVVKAKRKVPRSDPVAWEYLIEFPSGKQEWIKRYDARRYKPTNGEQ